MKEQDQKNTYEITFHVLSEEAADDVRGALRKHGAAISLEKPMQKARLAYPIKKQTYSFLGIIAFEADPETIVPLERDLLLLKSLVRFLVSKVFSRKEKPKKAKKADAPQPPDAPKRFKPFGESLSNEALEKKIEEILQ